MRKAPGVPLPPAHPPPPSIGPWSSHTLPQQSSPPSPSKLSWKPHFHPRLPRSAGTNSPEASFPLDCYSSSPATRHFPNWMPLSTTHLKPNVASDPFPSNTSSGYSFFKSHSPGHPGCPPSPLPASPLRFHMKAEPSSVSCSSGEEFRPAFFPFSLHLFLTGIIAEGLSLSAFSPAQHCRTHIQSTEPHTPRSGCLRIHNFNLLLEFE